MPWLLLSVVRFGDESEVFGKEVLPSMTKSLLLNMIIERVAFSHWKWPCSIVLVLYVYSRGFNLLELQMPASWDHCLANKLEKKGCNPLGVPLMAWVILSLTLCVAEATSQVLFVLVIACHSSFSSIFSARSHAARAPNSRFLPAKRGEQCTDAGVLDLPGTSVIWLWPMWL